VLLALVLVYHLFCTQIMLKHTFYDACICGANFSGSTSVSPPKFAPEPLSNALNSEKADWGLRH
jgi:hypothetical protein